MIGAHPGPSSRPTATILFLCTGNASRSVIAGAALRRCRPDLRVQTAGTLVVEGLPMSTRTRQAMHDVGLAFDRHRSRQATGDMLAQSDLVIAAGPEHVAWVRRLHPDHSERTATLVHLTAEPARPEGQSLISRVATLGLADHQPGPDEEVLDPGGGEVELYIAVARRIVELVDLLAPRL